MCSPWTGYQVITGPTYIIETDEHSHSRSHTRHWFLVRWRKPEHLENQRREHINISTNFSALGPEKGCDVTFVMRIINIY